MSTLRFNPIHNKVKNKDIIERRVKRLAADEDIGEVQGPSRASLASKATSRVSKN